MPSNGLDDYCSVFNASPSRLFREAIHVTQGLLRRSRDKAISTDRTDPRLNIQESLIGSGRPGHFCISRPICPHGCPLGLTSSPFFYVPVFWPFDFPALFGRTAGPAVRKAFADPPMNHAGLHGGHICSYIDQHRMPVKEA